MSVPDPTSRLPLLPLDDDVCFPGMEMTVRVARPEARRLLDDVRALEEEARWLGVVLCREDGHHDPFGRPEVYPGGTAGRLVDVSAHADGHSLATVAGVFRFEIERQLPGDEVYRHAVVRPLAEAALDEDDPGVARFRRRLLDLAEALLPELAEQVDLNASDLVTLRGDVPLAAVVNRLAAGLDLPAPRKLDLLLSALPERGRSLLSILESRRHVLDRLRPYRHLAAHPDRN